MFSDNLFSHLFFFYSSRADNFFKAKTQSSHRNVFRNYSSDADFPDHNKVLLPALSPTMEMGTIVSWAKKEGKN